MWSNKKRREYQEARENTGDYLRGIRESSEITKKKLAKKMCESYPMSVVYMQRTYVTGIESGRYIHAAISEKNTSKKEIFNLYLENISASEEERSGLKNLLEKMKEIKDIKESEEQVSRPDYDGMLQNLPSEVRRPIENLIEAMHDKHIIRRIRRKRR